MGRVISYILAFVLGGLTIYGLSNYDSLVGPSVLNKRGTLPILEMSYGDFVTVMFTGATLVLAGVALIVGIVAVFSYQGIKREARNAISDEVKSSMTKLDGQITSEVKEQAENQMVELFKNAGTGGELDEALQRALFALGQGNAESSGELEVTFDPDDNGER